MKTERLIELAKQWHQLENEQRQIDYRKSVWCREARAEFSTDRQFLQWCEIELGKTRAESEKLLAQADAAKIVTDASTWKKLGGSKQIEKLVVLPRKEQVACIEAAKVSGQKLMVVIRERHPTMAPAPTPGRIRRDFKDAEVLAQWIVDNHRGKLPAEVDVIVRMYIASFGSKRAA